MIVNEADLVFFGKLCFGQNVWSSYAFLMFACNYPKQLTYLKNVFEEKMLGIILIIMEDFAEFFHCMSVFILSSNLDVYIQKTE